MNSSCSVLGAVPEPPKLALLDVKPANQIRETINQPYPRSILEQHCGFSVVLPADCLLQTSLSLSLSLCALSTAMRQRLLNSWSLLWPECILSESQGGFSLHFIIRIANWELALPKKQSTCVLWNYNGCMLAPDANHFGSVGHQAGQCIVDPWPFRERSEGSSSSSSSSRLRVSNRQLDNAAVLLAASARKISNTLPLGSHF